MIHFHTHPSLSLPVKSQSELRCRKSTVIVNGRSDCLRQYQAPIFVHSLDCFRAGFVFFARSPMESLHKMKMRHKKEQKELKTTAGKGKGAAKDLRKLETELKEKQAAEISAMQKRHIPIIQPPVVAAASAKPAAGDEGSTAPPDGESKDADTELAEQADSKLSVAEQDPAVPAKLSKAARKRANKAARCIRLCVHACDGEIWCAFCGANCVCVCIFLERRRGGRRSRPRWPR